MELMALYKELLNNIGSQEWWPASRNFSPIEWEICAGAILTQNTNWKNVEKALDNLKENRIDTPQKTLNIKTELLEQIIRPSGFYKQKAERLKILAKLIHRFKNFSEFKKNITREVLLETKGIGPETADSILLYACNRPFFVIDAYTKRIVKAFGVGIPEDYETLRKHFENSIPKDIKIYKEFHALIVEWSKKERKQSRKIINK